MASEIPNITVTLRSGGEGEKLWAWMNLQTDDPEGCRPLLEEICLVADRLEEVRAKIATQGLLVSGPRGRASKNPLLDIELKLSKQYQLLWRTLGLADKLPDEDPRRPVGRPSPWWKSGDGGDSR